MNCKKRSDQKLCLIVLLVNLTKGQMVTLALDAFVSVLDACPASTTRRSNGNIR